VIDRASPSIIEVIIKSIRRSIMGAIAVSKKEEQQIERLRKELRIPTKAGVLRAALKVLEHQTAEERLREEVRESVRRCAAADKREHRDLAQAAVGRTVSDT
jgi:pyrroline-5-carboxylate reductase